MRSPSLTDHIVAVLIAYQILKVAIPFLVDSSQYTDDFLPLLRIAELDASFNHVAGKFVFRIDDEVGYHQCNNGRAILFSTMFDDMLCHIVTVLVHDQVGCASVKLLQDGGPGRLDAMLQHALYDPTAICVFRELAHLSSESIDDELDMHGWYPFNCFLYDVVAVLILDTSHDLFVLLQLRNQGSLLILQDMFQSLDVLVESQRGPRQIRTFCTTRQPYICSDNANTWFFIWLARVFFCDWLPCSKNFWIT